MNNVKSTGNVILRQALKYNQVEPLKFILRNFCNTPKKKFKDRASLRAVRNELRGNPE
jgi:hypothetical protein